MNNAAKRPQSSDANFTVHGVSVHVTVEGDAAVERIFPALYALPRRRAAAHPWNIRVSAGGPPPGLPEPDRVSVMRIPPDTAARCWEDSDGRLCISVRGASGRIDARRRHSSLWLDPDAAASFEPLGRAIVSQILRHEGLFPIHAGAVEVSGGAVLICGASGKGKSTLAAAWSCSGNARFMAQDSCVVFQGNDAPWAGGIADQLTLTPDSVRLIEEMGIRIPRPIGSHKGKRSYHCHEFFLSLCEDPYPVRMLLFLDAGMPDRELIRSCTTEEAFALLRVASACFGPAAVLQAHFDMLAHLSARRPAFFVNSRAKGARVVAALDRLAERQEARIRPLHPPPEQRLVRGSREDTAAARRTLGELISNPRTRNALDPAHVEAWCDLVRSADREGVLPVLAATLEQTGVLPRLDNPPGNVLRVALRRAYDVRRIHIEMLDKLGRALQQGGVAWAVLDGPSVAERFYACPAARYYHRLDILTHPDMDDLAVRILQDLGFSLSTGVPAGLALTDPAHPYAVLLHAPGQSRAALERMAAFDIGEIVQSKCAWSVERAEIPVVSAANQFLLTCLRPDDKRRTEGLVHLCDIAMMARSIPEAGCLEAIEIAGRMECLPAIGSVVRQAIEVFPAATPARMAAMLNR